MSLADEKCVPPGRRPQRLDPNETRRLAGELGGQWLVVEEARIEREFQFPDFATALAFTNAIGAIAESEGHHPDICLGWGKARVTISTHDVNGLSRADFVLAAKIDRVS